MHSTEVDYDVIVLGGGGADSIVAGTGNDSIDGGSGNERITRGGSWWYGPERQVADDLATKPRDTRVVYIGFRCARDLRR